MLINTWAKCLLATIHLIQSAVQKGLVSKGKRADSIQQDALSLNDSSDVLLQNGSSSCNLKGVFVCVRVCVCGIAEEKMFTVYDLRHESACTVPR